MFRVLQDILHVGRVHHVARAGGGRPGGDDHGGPAHPEWLAGHDPLVVVQVDGLAADGHLSCFFIGHFASPNVLIPGQAKRKNKTCSRDNAKQTRRMLKLGVCQKTYQLSY